MLVLGGICMILAFAAFGIEINPTLLVRNIMSTRSWMRTCVWAASKEISRHGPRRVVRVNGINERLISDGIDSGNGSMDGFDGVCGGGMGIRVWIDDSIFHGCRRRCCVEILKSI